MKPIVIIQNMPHYPTPWGDAVNAWNTASWYQGLGIWKAKDYLQQLGFWAKTHFNIVLGRVIDKESTLLLYHFASQGMPVNRMAPPLHREIDMQPAFDYLDKNPKANTVAFGTIFNPTNDKLDNNFITQNSCWFARETAGTGFSHNSPAEVEINRRFVKLPDNEVIDNEANKLYAITWFFMYRAVDLPIYYIVPNPDMMGVAPNVDTEGDEPVRFYVTTPHFGSIGDLVFRPTFSKNIARLAAGKYVTGDEFWVEPFANGLFSWKYNEVVPKTNIKVISNLDWTIDAESNRVHFKFNPDQEQGYVNIRWNENGIMGLTQTAVSLDNLENKCNIMLDVYKNSRYKYTGD
jgi:hypothetical protein